MQSQILLWTKTFALILFLGAQLEALELHPRDWSNLKAIAQSPTVPQMLDHVIHFYPDLRVVMTGEDPQWRDHRICNTDYNSLSIYDLNNCYYHPAHDPHGLDTLMVHPLILLNGSALNGAVIHELLHYFIDRNRLAALPVRQQSEPIDFFTRVKVEYELLLHQNKSSPVAHSIALTQFILFRNEMFHLEEAEIVLFVGEKSKDLNISIS